MTDRLPPCGGSGLKWQLYFNYNAFVMSPSMRREWIEIPLWRYGCDSSDVSLHAEGVD